MSPRALYDELIAKIAGVRRLEHWVALEGAVLRTATATLAAWTLATVIEAVGHLDAAERTTLFHGTLVLNIALAAWLLLPALARLAGIVRGQDDHTLARRIGAALPAVGDRLVNTLQLFSTGGAGALALGYSPELVEASVLTIGEPLRHHDYSVIIERDERRRAVWLFLSAAIVAGALVLGFPEAFRSAFDRLMNYTAEFIAPAPFALSVEPGDRTVVRGDSIEIVVRASGIPPRNVTLHTASQSGAPEEIVLRGDANGLFRYRIVNVKETMTYGASAGPVRSGEHTIRVVDRPEIGVLRVTIAHPGYTGRGVERLPDNVGDVSGLRGSLVTVSVTTNIEPARATIVQLFPRHSNAPASSAATASIISTSAPAAAAMPAAGYDTVRIAMAIDGAAARGSFRLSRGGEYYIDLVSRDGLRNPSPVHYRMSASIDASPTITLIAPADSSDVDRTMLLPVEVHISDDYGFSRLRIMYRLAASKYAEPSKEFHEQRIQLPKAGGLSVDVPYIWNMTRLSMVPEDVVELYVEVADNDVVSGPKVARTDTVRVRFPSLDEVLQKAEKTQADASAELNRMLKQAQESAKEMESLNRELMKQMAQNEQQASWQNRQKLQELMKQREQMEQHLQQVAENLRAMTEKLQEAKAITPETLQKYAELQKLFDALKNPALLEQMKKMEQQMNKMSPEDLAEAMKNYKYNDEQFRKAIERTMNILKRMQAEQKVDEMVRRAEELEQQQQKLNEQMAKTDPADAAMRQQLAEHQEQLAKDAQRMEEEMRDLAKQMEALGEEAPKQEMADAQQSLEKESPREGMQQASDEMQKGDMQNARQQGQRAQQAASDFKQKMQAVKKKMQENGRRDVTNKMKKSLNDLLELSKREEELKRKTDAAQPNSQQLHDLAEQQLELAEQMENLTNQMMSLGQKTFAVTPEMGKELGNALQQMAGASGSLEKRDGGSASEQEGSAMGSMNNAARMMSQALGQMQNQGQDGQGMAMGMGQGSMQQRLQQMAAQQQMINQAMSEQMGEGQQGKQQGEGKEGEGEGKEGEGKEGKEGKDGKNGKQNGAGANGEGGEEGQEGKNGKNGTHSDRLQHQQEDVRKSLDELNKEARESGGTRKNMLGDLERASKEIDQVLTDMKSGEITPQTLERQERILSRLLDAARSQRERDFEKKRESRPGQDVVREGPGELKFNGQDAADPNRRDPLDVRDQGYTKDYEYMIRRYFEMLGKGTQSELH